MQQENGLVLELIEQEMSKNPQIGETMNSNKRWILLKAHPPLQVCHPEFVVNEDQVDNLIPGIQLSI